MTDLERLTRLLDERIPAELVAALLELAASPDADRLSDARYAFEEATDNDDNRWRDLGSSFNDQTLGGSYLRARLDSGATSATGVGAVAL